VADTSELLDAIIVSPVSDRSLLYRSPISYIRPVCPNTVMLSPTLNGLVLAKYNPAIRLPMSDCEANPITSPVIVVIEAAKVRNYDCSNYNSTSNSYKYLN
jgi:hypothetical protein